MELFKLNELDYRTILVQNYKELKLTENELVVLLLIDSLSKEKKSLISGDLLTIKMNLNSKEIDEIIVSLMNKDFLSYEQCDGILITSMNKCYQKMIELIKNRVFNDKDEETLKQQEEGVQKVLKIIEEEMKRSPTPLELETIVNWFKDGINENLIIHTINECIMKGGRLTIKQIDNTLSKNIAHVDRVEEGFSTVDEKTKKDIRKAMDIASYDWVNNND